MLSRIAKFWHRYVPAYARNPFWLVFKLLRSGKPAARSALYNAIAGILLTPFDWSLQFREKRIYCESPAPGMPIIIVVGAPRSGTTLVAQFLINALQVCYINNLTAMFPRSPIAANRLLGAFLSSRPGDFEAYYGKSRGASGTNDGLHIWDRWLGTEREKIPTVLQPGSGTEMPAFFGALQQLYGLPVVNKVNRLNACANLVAAELEHVRFVCVRRDPLYLAQSLYIARQEIMGDLQLPYGLEHTPRSTDPVEDVCLQVAFHEQLVSRQHELLGSDRFHVIWYEDFCANPSELVATVMSCNAAIQPREKSNKPPSHFAVSVNRRLPPEIFDELRHRLNEMALVRPGDRS